MQRHERNLLEVRLERCKDSCRKVVFLGHEVSAGIRRSMAKHLEAVNIWPQPKNPKQLKGWLGFVGLYSAYMEELAKKSVCLFNLLRKGAAWDWSPECQAPFKNITEQLLTGKC